MAAPTQAPDVMRNSRGLQIRNSLGDACLTYQSDLNIFYKTPRSFAPPAMIIRGRSHRTIQYHFPAKGVAKWQFLAQFVIGAIDEEWAQELAWEIVSPRSKLILALEAAQIPGGYARVVTGAVSEMTVGPALYTHGEFEIEVVAG